MSVRLGPDRGTYVVEESDQAAGDDESGRGKQLVCTVHYLDHTNNSFTLDRRAKGQMLLDEVFSQLELVEKEYFGLQFPELCPTGQSMRWLDPAKSIRKQAKFGPPFHFYFRVKFYVTDPSRLQEEYTRYHFFLQLKRDIREGRLTCPRDKAILLASYAVQSELGDYSAQEHRAGYLTELQFHPDQDESFLAQVEQQHRQHRFQTPADAERQYLQHARTLEMYGVELHTARDSSQRDVQLGVSALGVVVFLNRARYTVYHWSRIVKISFKRKQFFVQLRRDKAGQSSTEVVEQLVGFTLSSYRSCKNLWKSCVEHHTFFRLHTPRQPAKRNLFALGSKFYYSGRTEYQTVEEMKKRSRGERPFSRAPSRSFARRTVAATSREAILEERSGDGQRTVSGRERTSGLVSPLRSPVRQPGDRTTPRSDVLGDRSTPPRHVTRSPPRHATVVKEANGQTDIIQKLDASPERIGEGKRAWIHNGHSPSSTFKQNRTSTGDPVRGDPVRGDPVRGDPVRGDPVRETSEAALSALPIYNTEPPSGAQPTVYSTEPPSGAPHTVYSTEPPSGAQPTVFSTEPPSGAQPTVYNTKAPSSAQPIDTDAHTTALSETTPGSTNGQSPSDKSLVTIRIKPDSLGRFGFNVKGGVDQGMPITVSRVATNSPAYTCRPRLQQADQVLFINGRDVSRHTHEQVVMFIRAARETHSGELVLVVRPRAAGESPTEPGHPGTAVDDPTSQSSGDSCVSSSTPPEVMSLRESMKLLQEGLTSGQLVQQFEHLPRKNPSLSMNCARLSENISKNRYRDISPYDVTRVVLHDGQNGDYINANHVNMEIPGCGIVNRYIAGQGPLPSTCADFWQMVWEAGSSLVVMLTTQYERGREKCHQYWPDLYETAEYGRFQITCLSEEANNSLAFREMTILHMQSNEERHVRQMQYMSWPDHGVPDDPRDFLSFTQRVRNSRAGNVEPVVVHCSAGIGRTGVLITMETAMCLMEAGQCVCALSIVNNMRQQRAMLIQNSSQFKFVCEAILRVYKQGLCKPLDDTYSTPR